MFLATRDRIIVVDPMGEYSPLIKRLGGQVIEIAPDSPHHINPMDIDLSFDEENPMALKADFILSLMELIVGGKDGLQPVERTVIDRFKEVVNVGKEYKSFSGINSKMDGEVKFIIETEAVKNE